MFYVIKETLVFVSCGQSNGLVVETSGEQTTMSVCTSLCERMVGKETGQLCKGITEELIVGYLDFTEVWTVLYIG